ncbi:kinase-like protein, partial [Rhizophagus irregularis]
DNEDECHYCNRKYDKLDSFEPKFCHYCLRFHINFIAKNTKYTIKDMYIFINYTNNNRFCDYENIIESRKDCKLCGKLIYEQTSIDSEYKLCSNCYKISFEFCNKLLEFESDCQKLCSSCFIFYIGCRYCLTTNIIFGYTNQSKCSKCKRIFIIEISGNYIIDKFLYFTNVDNNDKYCEIVNYINNTNKNSNPLNIYSFIPDGGFGIIYKALINGNVVAIKKISGSQEPNKYFLNEFDYHSTKPKIKWVSYSQINILKKIAEGGFGIIYKALINGDVVVIKKILNSQEPNKYFLNELKSLYQCYDNKFECIIKCHGITKDPITKELMFIMKYANGGDLHNYLQKNFAEITWKKKLHILWRISDGLQTIHEKDFVHRDFHSGNILIEIIENDSCKIDQYLIGDLGLSLPANDIPQDNIIYGVISYIAPEIFKGIKFSKSSDIYCMGMIMWELTTGCKPFANVEHDVGLIYKIIDGKRPNITDDTPEDFANLTKKCWNPDPKMRPSATEDSEYFDQAEEIRLELIKSKILEPDFNEKSHPKAIYTSRSITFNTKPNNELIDESVNNKDILQGNMNLI